MNKQNEKALSSAYGKIIDLKVLETEKGKTLAHLQIQDEDRRISNVLIPSKVYTKWNPLILETFKDGGEIEFRGSIDDQGTQVLLIAEQVATPGT